MMFLLSEKLYHINVICVTGFSRKPNIFLSKNVTPVGNYDTASLWRGIKGEVSASGGQPPISLKRGD
jgi:hypothetical protein